MRSHSPPLPSICEALYHVPEPAEPSQPSEYLPAHPPLLSESSIVLYDALEPRCAAQFPYPHSPTFRDLPERPSPSLGPRRAALRSCQASAGPTSVPRSVPSTSADSKLHNGFVCARTNKHRLGFQFCPRTHTLLRRNLVRISAAGRRGWTKSVRVRVCQSHFDADSHFDAHKSATGLAPRLYGREAALSEV
ncbi:hypothetical protein MKEN_00575400 [Mycena kentingensis (nom. inval.)]|nr:hypothetical protein MKEN_00575400 [Mycena kentingensis (nom. inval.)]